MIFFPVETPLIAQSLDPEAAIPLMPRGGLLRATTSRDAASLILPPDPNQLLAAGTARPRIQVGPRTPQELVRLLTRHRKWLDADLPADPFAEHQQFIVLDAITRELVSLVAGPKWSRLERTLNRDNLLDRLEVMRALVGEAPAQRALAKTIADHLWLWADSESTLVGGFADAVADLAWNAEVKDVDSAAPFLLELARSPGSLMDWDQADRDVLLDIVRRSGRHCDPCARHAHPTNGCCSMHDDLEEES